MYKRSPGLSRALIRLVTQDYTNKITQVWLCQTLHAMLDEGTFVLVLTSLLELMQYIYIYIIYVYNVYIIYICNIYVNILVESCFH